jgi:hypothetical protein
MVHVSIHCDDCGVEHTCEVPREAIVARNSGALVQEAFPMLDRDQRELFFVSGKCDKCWKKLMLDDSEMRD